MDKNKVLYLDSAFSIKQDGSEDSIFIEGYASTVDKDRQGDVVDPQAWKKGLENYLKNPIILAYHDHDDPVGRMVEHRIDKRGLWIKARISAAAEIYNLVKDNVLTAFSIGFKIMDADYDKSVDVFLIKELELVEISVVSVPANQNTLFSLAKAFKTPEQYTNFKEQFAPKGESAKGLESTTEAKSATMKEWKMNPEEIKQMLADAAKAAAEEATKSLLAAQAAERQQLTKAADAAAELDNKIKATVEATIKTVDSGAERLLAEVSKRLEQQNDESKNALAGLEAAIKEKTAELAKIQQSKMQFADMGNSDAVSYEDREKAVFLAKMAGKAVKDTKFGAQLLEKAGGHLTGTTNTTGLISAPQSIWELEVSTNMENEVRRRLVVAPLFRNINMQTNVMKMPLNPEAGLATWVQNSEFGDTASPGTAQTHTLKEVTLSAYKLATREYLAYEEEEDSILAILPVVRDAMVRRTARSLDRAFLYGAGSGADPVKGVARYEATSSLTPTYTGTVSVANMRTMRKNLGAWGLDPSQLVFVVSTEVYYDLLDDTTFQTMNQVGPQATLLTGQIGQIGNTPVLVSGEFPTKPTSATTSAGSVFTNLGALCIAPGNFLAGSQRGLRFDTQELVETQRRVLVASLRTGLTQVTTNLGQGVATLHWS
jgi:HK97 family phage prohead protease/HK97 family phage major capsid protein